ncbi:MAG: aldehyde dehydrogenase family protein [Chloroflexi bacterium]|nr:MAG: aldehyde dehydrogenase family protein [Chloroflexota bacterium]
MAVGERTVPKLGLFIGGEEREARRGRTFASIDPATEEVCGLAPDAGVEDVGDAVAAARRAFDEGPWPGMSPRQRSEALLRLRDAMVAHRDELHQISLEECGMTRAGRLANVDGAIGQASWFGEHCARPDVEPLPPIVSRDGGVVGSMIVREPVGVVAAITPFNMPLIVSCGKVFPALGMGCTVVLKPSPLTPLNGLMLGRLAQEAGLPDGVLNVVTGEDPALGEALVADPQVDKVSFTGSSAVGKRILAACAPQVKRCLLELGGKSPSLVLEDCDIELTVRGALFPYLTHAGQACVAMTRVVVPDSIHDGFVDKLTAAVQELSVGDPRDPSTVVPPVISARQRDRVEDYIRSGVAEGARLAAGGSRPAHLPRGYYVEPTLFVDSTNQMRINREEIFGPVAAVIRYSGDVDEGVRLANDTTYGLNATVWTSNRARGMEVARRLRAGQAGINGYTAGPWSPIGGMRESGIGRERGVLGMLEYTEVKHVHWR